MVKQIRLYGEFQGEHSTARVSRGFLRAFEDLVVPCELSPCEQNGLDDVHEEPPGADAKVGIYTGNLRYFASTFRAKHERIFVMVAPNSDKIGPVLKGFLENVDTILVPSRWAMGVVRASMPGKNVMVVPHGVSPEYRRLPGDKELDDFTVLHLSSSVFERKGTDKLLQGWALARLPKAKLFLSVPAGKKLDFFEMVQDLEISDSVSITDRLDLSDEGMGALYNSVDLVAQPSRGEGFGMVPLEARCCGTPVLMTDCTGHSEHAGGAGCTIVKTREDAPIDDFPGAHAPSLHAEDVAEALVSAYMNREELSAAAKVAAVGLRNTWSWENQLKEFRDVVYRSVCG